MMDTLLLDTETGDICLDANGNIALASAPYSIAQDVASAAKTLLGECWYDTTLGVPWRESILGYSPPAQFVAAAIEAEAVKVPGVASARCIITALDGRVLSGQIRITDTSGDVSVAQF